METEIYQMHSQNCRFCQIKKYISLFSLLFIFVYTAGVTVFAQTPTDTAALKADKNYKIGVGDVLKVIVVKQDLLSIDNLRVGNGGTIRMPMIEGEITAACLTETELSTQISEKYKKYLLNPQVYVTVREFNSNPVALVGAITTPGRFQLQRPMRLLELLTYVNGPSTNAGRSVQIIRTSKAKQCGDLESKADSFIADEDQQEMISLPLAEVMKGNENANPFVRAGDIIRVTEAEQAFVIGNVKTAVTINLKEPVTLSKAIAMAGGTAPGAQIEKIRILRQKPDSLAKTEIYANLKDINKRNQEDIILEGNDIIDVPGESGTRKLLKDIFRTAIPAITRVPIVIP